ncbi:MAG: M48 family metallopeptidase [Sulfurimonadaceae bacterium]
MSFNSSLPDDTVNVSKQSPLFDLLWMSGGVLTIILIFYFVFGVAIEYGVKKISTEQEIKLFSFLQSDHHNTETKSEQLLTIKTLLRESKECQHSPYNFVVHIVQSEDINAFALPGGTIIINSELLKSVRSENELFFVLAHEIGHFKNRDHLEGVGRTFLAVIIGNIMGFADVSEVLDSALALSESQFSQKQESEADLYAVELMNCYYGHVNGSTDFFKHLPKENSYSLFSSHPKIEKRIKSIKNHIEKSTYITNRDLLPLVK